ncbi:MAG: class I SAM-dependent methyltransferase [Deltaproteobacteria bacterium]|nr:class I SAM-dependent methyltransferase [Deltaproteobacteria bacterium]
MHAWGRWMSCPFEAIASEVPERGKILEIGCGHALFTAHLAMTSPHREVVGIDISPEKIVVARETAHWLSLKRGNRFEVRLTEPGQIPKGPWDAIVIVDVLYLMTYDDQRSLLEAAARELGPCGRLIIKEMSDAPRWKTVFNRFQESLAVNVLRFTTGKGLHFVPPAEIVGWLESAGLSHASSRRLDHASLHPHHLLVFKK